MLGGGPIQQVGLYIQGLGIRLVVRRRKRGLHAGFGEKAALNEVD
jgi:hypothetical protein